MALINNINEYMNGIKLKPTTESIQSTLNYWIKIYDNYVTQTPEFPLLFQKNVSIDYIKGIYCAVRYPISNIAHNYYIKIYSNFELISCMYSDIILVFESRYNNFDSQHLFEYNNKDIRSKILCDPKKHNKKWEQFMEKYAHNKIGNTKRFLALIGIDTYNYVIQFNSIDFLNGFEMVRTWSDNQSYNVSIHLSSIYDTLKICKTSITFRSSRKEMNELLIIFREINKYLPKVLTQLILQKIAQQCDHHLTNGYDLCLTHSDKSSCYFHQKKGKYKILQLEKCLPQIHLEQL